MKQSPAKEKKIIFTKKNIIVVGVAAFLLILVGFYFYNFTSFSPKNYARDVASPIENELIAAGVVKVCEDSVNGKSALNRTPSYNAYYKTKLDTKHAVELMQSIEGKTGFSFELSDEATGVNYADRSKTSQFPDLETGNVSAVLSIYDSAKKLSCPDGGLSHDDNNVAIVLSVVLPPYRK